MTAAEQLKAIRTQATHCPTCLGAPNPNNFGGLCDPCDAKKAQRLARSAALLREHGQENTDTGRALTALGY